MYGHDDTWSLEKLGTDLNISSEGRLFYSNSTKTKDFLKHQKYHSTDTTTIDASIIQNTILKSSNQYDGSAYPSWNATLVKERLRMWEHVLTTNVFIKIDPREIMEAQVESWFDEDVWINAEDHISTDEEIEEMTLRNMSFGDRMAYKSYVTEKRQRRETRMMFEW
ncbi:hypothetical protein Tco_1344959 [Tanacetum coccineum]